MRAKLVGACAIVALAACGGKTNAPLDAGPTYTFTPLKASPADKLDVLFAIDNSASMADKQSILAAAIPSFLGRLLNPSCIDSSTNAVSPGDGQGCATMPGTKPEFPPVHDLHMAVVSSSLGGGGSPDVCVESSGDPTHVNDHGHLLNRTFNGTSEGTLANAKPIDGNGGQFLAWLPSSDPKNAGTMLPNVTAYTNTAQATQLVSDFQALVTGVEQHGCGLEAQLESWYHFLVQPDPWNDITQTNDNPPENQLDGVDAVLLKMRKDFLRPDSLVAIVQLTDEEDSWSDPLWLGGFGWTSRTQAFPGGPGAGAGPRGTSECDAPVDINNVATTGPNNPDCTSCAFPGSNKPISQQLIGTDPNCNSCAGGATTCPQKGWYTPASTSAPIASADGLNVRYASQLMRSRYGFDSQLALQRYVDGLTMSTVPDRDHEGSHTSSADYGKSVQRNCTNPLFAANLPDGSDTSSGAVCNLKLGSRTPDMIYFAIIGGLPPSLVGGDWNAIVGKDPEHFVFDGIDPRMIQSTSPRPGVTGDWNTLRSAAGIDYEYACTFDLAAPKDCTLAQNISACDCTGSTAPDGPPLCSPSNPSLQIKGKAYPTIRELRIAQALGAQSIVGSICDPSGYGGTLDKLVTAMSGAFSGDCLPPGTPAPGCSLVVVYPNQTNQAAGCVDPGMSQPAPSLIEAFAKQSSSAAPVVCAYTEQSDCNTSNAGWCIKQTGSCNELAFTPEGPPAGTQIMLVCPTTH